MLTLYVLCNVLIVNGIGKHHIILWKLPGFQVYLKCTACVAHCPTSVCLPMKIVAHQKNKANKAQTHLVGGLNPSEKY